MVNVPDSARGSNPSQGHCVEFLGYDTLRSEYLTPHTGINRHQPSEFSASKNPAWTSFRLPIVATGSLSKGVFE